MSLETISLEEVGDGGGDVGRGLSLKSHGGDGWLTTGVLC